MQNPEQQVQRAFRLIASPTPNPSPLGSTRLADIVARLHGVFRWRFSIKNGRPKGWPLPVSQWCCTSTLIWCCTHIRSLVAFYEIDLLADRMCKFNVTDRLAPTWHPDSVPTLSHWTCALQTPPLVYILPPYFAAGRAYPLATLIPRLPNPPKSRVSTKRP